MKGKLEILFAKTMKHIVNVWLLKNGAISFSKDRDIPNCCENFYNTNERGNDGLYFDYQSEKKRYDSFF